MSFIDTCTMFSPAICHLLTPHYQLSSVNFISYCVGFFSLAGHAPQDGRGKHNNRPHRLTDETVTLVCGHISSFRGRHSHYAMGETRKLYLPDTLNVAKMHHMFVSVHPETKVCVCFYVSDIQIEDILKLLYMHARILTCS